jgi:hypothetical protein
LQPPARANSNERPTLGAVELVALPEWGVERLAARVDTGARTSALHVEELSELGDGRVRFAIPLAGEPRVVEATVSRRGRVRSTSGKLAARVFVTALVRVGSVEARVELGLVDRRKMRFRMLLGRSALAGRFVVDVSRSYRMGR